MGSRQTAATIASRLSWPRSEEPDPRVSRADSERARAVRPCPLREVPRVGERLVVAAPPANERPTAAEFFSRMSMRADERNLLLSYYRTLRRLGLGQTASLVGALWGLDLPQGRIAYALGCNRRRVARHWEKIRVRLRVRGSGALVQRLNDERISRAGRRPKPTPQERPFTRLEPSRRI